MRTNILAGYFNDVSDLFQKMTSAHVKNHWRLAQMGFVPNNFGLFRSHCYFGALYSINFKEVV